MRVSKINTRFAVAITSVVLAGICGLWAVDSVSAEEPQPRIIPAGYRVETIPIPEGVQFGVAGLDVAANGDVYAGTRYGEVWRYRAGQWSLFADGLHEVTGVTVDGKSGGVFVMQKPELTQLIDDDGDGQADVYRCVSADFGFSGNYHEFAFGPVRDKAGNLYCTLNLSHGQGPSIKGGIMSVGERYRGTCFRVTPRGKFDIFAWGMRSPAGLGIDPRTDDIFYTDNQGDYNASSSLQHVVKDSFHGHPGSFLHKPDYKGKDINAIPDDEFLRMRQPIAAWIPHGEIANSPGNPVFDLTGGKFGPFEGQIFIGDQGRSNVFRVALEKVGGVYQGCVINCVDHLQSGAIRLAFAPDGSMWVGQTSRGWGSAGGVPYGVQRIVYDGKTVPFEIHSVKITNDGFDVTMTRPIKRDAIAPGNFQVQHWGYMYHAKYGSPKVSPTQVNPGSTVVSEDGKTVRLKLGKLEANRVYQLTLNDITGEDGALPTTRNAYYTVSVLK